MMSPMQNQAMVQIPCVGGPGQPLLACCVGGPEPLLPAGPMQGMPGMPGMPPVQDVQQMQPGPPVFERGFEPPASPQPHNQNLMALLMSGAAPPPQPPVQQVAMHDLPEHLQQALHQVLRQPPSRQQQVERHGAFGDSPATSPPPPPPMWKGEGGRVRWGDVAADEPSEHWQQALAVPPPVPPPPPRPAQRARNGEGERRSRPRDSPVQLPPQGPPAGACDSMRMRWGDDDMVWRGHAPMLQPVCGSMPDDMLGPPPVPPPRLDDGMVVPMQMPTFRNSDMCANSGIDLSKLLIGGKSNGQWSGRKQRGGGPALAPRFQGCAPVALRVADMLAPPGPGAGQRFGPQQGPQAPHGPAGGARLGTKEQRQRRRPGQGQPGARAPAGPTAAPVALDTMKAQLQSLQLEDPETVFIARRINKLGFSSSDILREYFSGYGQVNSIHVSHSRVKNLRVVSEHGADEQWRLRPAALGFVVMATREATARILAEGAQHCVKGVVVRIQPFHHNPPDAMQIEQEANVASIVDDPKEKAADDAPEVTEQPRSVSPDSDIGQPGFDSRSVSQDSGSIGPSTSGAGAGFSRLDSGSSGPSTSASGNGSRRLDQSGVDLQDNQPPRSKEQGGVDYRKAVETEMEMLYNNFVVSGGPVV